MYPTRAVAPLKLESIEPHNLVVVHQVPYPWKCFGGGKLCGGAGVSWLSGAGGEGVCTGATRH